VEKIKLIPNNYRWSKNAIDYSAGVDIHDYETGITYSKEEAERLPQHIKMNLCNKPRKIGCWVVTSYTMVEDLE